MNGEAEYLFKEVNRKLLLLRGENNKSVRDSLVDEIKHDTSELKRLWEESE